MIQIINFSELFHKVYARGAGPHYCEEMEHSLAERVWAQMLPLHPEGITYRNSSDNIQGRIEDVIRKPKVSQ